MSAQPPFEENQNTEAVPAAQTNNTLKIVLITFLVIVLTAASGGGVWYYLSHKSTDKTEEASEEENKEADPAEASGEDSEESDEKGAEPIFVTLEPFTVNLLPEGQFLQATFVLQIKDEKEAERVKAYTPQIRSRLLLMLSGKTAEALSNPAGKTELIKEIKQLVGQPFKAGQKPVTVEEVHITAFIIQ